MHRIEITEQTMRRLMGRRGKLQIYDRIEPARSALIVVDMQNCFLAPGMPAELPVGREIVPNINRLAAAFRDSGGHVVWIRNTLLPETRRSWSVWTDKILNKANREAMYREMAPGSLGHELYPDLDVRPEDAQIRKCRFSAFIQGASDLHAHLQERGIDTVVITGVATHVCCESTARDAMMLNYQTLFVSDGCAAFSDADHNGALNALIQSFCDVQDTDQVIRTLAAGVKDAAAAAQ